jgi:ribosomal protein S16
MVVIRLSRGGAKHRPFYNIVVADKRVRRDDDVVERTVLGAAAGESNDDHDLSFGWMR